MALAGGSPERFPQTRVQERSENTTVRGNEEWITQMETSSGRYLKKRNSWRLLSQNLLSFKNTGHQAI